MMEQWWEEQRRDAVSGQEAASIVRSFLRSRCGDVQATEEEVISKVVTYLDAELASGQHSTPPATPSRKEKGKSPKKGKKEI